MSKLARTFIAQWGPVLLCMGLIFYLSSFSDPYTEIPAKLQPADRVNLKGETQAGENLLNRDEENIGKPSHVLEYALLGFFLTRAVCWGRSYTLALGMFSIFLCFLYAITDEFHQGYFVAGRAFESADLLLDGLGILTGLATFWLMNLFGAKTEKQLESK